MKSLHAGFILICLFLIVCTIITLTGCAQDAEAIESVTPPALSEVPEPQAPPTSEIPPPEIASDGMMGKEQMEAYAGLKKYLADKPVELGFQGSIIVELGDEVLLDQSYGLADKAAQTPNSSHTIYEAGEINWQFTAAAVMLLVESGQISLDDTMDMYIEDYPYGSRITIKNLMMNRSGIPDYRFRTLEKDEALFLQYTGLTSKDELYKKRISREVSKSEIVQLMSPYSLLFNPGNSITFSGTDYYFLGLIVEKASGMTYEEFVAKNIFEPLEMSASSFDPMKTTAVGYAQKGSDTLPVMSYHPSLTFSNASLCTSCEDLMKWANAVLDKKLLSAESWKQIFSIQKVNDYGFGSGWVVSDYGYFFRGHTNGFNGYICVSPGKKYKIVVLSNVYKGGTGPVTESEAVADPLIRRMNAYLKEYPW